MIDLRQKELSDWADLNFGDLRADTMECIVGMIEELGELAHVVLKRKQRIREAADGGDFKLEIGDAFADVVIFGIQAMTCEGIDAEAVIKKTINTVLQRDFKNNPAGIGYSQHKVIKDD